METFGIILQAVAFLLALLAAVLLFWVNKEKNHSKHMLVLLLIVLSLLNLNGVLFHTGWYLDFPWFHKIALPFSLLPYPFAWLYIRSVLYVELKFKSMIG